MADEDTERMRAVAAALERVFDDQVLDTSEPSFWTLRAAELIEEMEAEGILIE